MQHENFLVHGPHVHAEHPNELCSMLNGFDANGKYSSRDSWAKLLPEWDAYLRWLVANGQNYFDWSLLSGHLLGGDFHGISWLKKCVLGFGAGVGVGMLRGRGIPLLVFETKKCTSSWFVGFVGFLVSCILGFLVSAFLRCFAANFKVSQIQFHGFGKSLTPNYKFPYVFSRIFRSYQTDLQELSVPVVSTTFEPLDFRNSEIT